jgi:hypothetical protein
MNTPANPYDQFDTQAIPAPPIANPYDQFDAVPTQTAGAVADAAQAAINPAPPVAGRTGNAAVDLPRIFGTAAADGVGGLLSLPRDLAQGVDYVGGKLGYQPGADNALAQVQAGGQQLFPNAQNAANMAFDTMGATRYQANNAAGRMAQAGAANIVPALASGGASILPAMAGGAVGEGAAEAVPGHPVLARLLGFMFGAHSANAVANAGAKAAGMVTGTAPTTPLFQAYQRQGIPTTLSGDVTQNPNLQLAQSIATKMPGGSEAIRDAGHEAVEAWQNAVEKNASLLGPSATMEEAGTGLQNSVQQWLQDWKNTSNQKWSAFRQAVPADTPIPIAGFQDALNSVNHDFGGSSALANVLQPATASKIQGAVTEDTASQNPPPTPATAWVPPPPTLPWQTVQAVRSRIGEMMEPNAPVTDMAGSALKRLYGGLSGDMQAGASSVSPAAAQAFNDANSYTAMGHSLIDDHLKQILNAASPEAAAQYALGQVKQGSTRLQAIEQAAPGQVADLGAAKLRIAAPNGPGALPTMLKNISPEAQNILFSGPASQGVNDLAQVSKAMRNTAQMTGNNSNTAAHETNGLGRVMVAIEMAKHGREVAGLPGAAAGAAMGLFAPTAVGAAARTFGANPLLSRIYSTEPGLQFTAPNALSPSVLDLSQVGQPDRRLYGQGNNLLLSH